MHVALPKYYTEGMGQYTCSYLTSEETEGEGVALC